MPTTWVFREELQAQRRLMALRSIPILFFVLIHLIVRKRDRSGHPSLCNWYRGKMGTMLKALHNEINANFSKL
jgi:hypothetical protein